MLGARNKFVKDHASNDCRWSSLKKLITEYISGQTIYTRIEKQDIIEIVPLYQSTKPAVRQINAVFQNYRITTFAVIKRNIISIRWSDSEYVFFQLLDRKRQKELEDSLSKTIKAMWYTQILAPSGFFYEKRL